MKRLSVLKFLSQETSKRAHEFLHDFYTKILQLELFHNIKYSDFLYVLVWYSTVLLGVLCYTNLSIKYVYCISVAGTALIKMVSLGTPCCPICFYGISNFNS